MKKVYKWTVVLEIEIGDGWFDFIEGEADDIADSVEKNLANSAPYIAPRAEWGDDRIAPNPKVTRIIL